jgi:hypothetical protein
MPAPMSAVDHPRPRTIARSRRIFGAVLPHITSPNWSACEVYFITLPSIASIAKSIAFLGVRAYQGHALGLWRIREWSRRRARTEPIGSKETLRQKVNCETCDLAAALFSPELDDSFSSGATRAAEHATPQGLSKATTHYGWQVRVKHADREGKPRRLLSGVQYMAHLAGKALGKLE